MKVKFLKPHMGFAAGDTPELPTDRANYLIRTGVAEKISVEAEQRETKPDGGFNKRQKKSK